MELPYGVLAVLVALVIWTGLGIDAVRRRSLRVFLGFGIAVLLCLNAGYFLRGIPGSIAFFIGIYDVLNNVGLGAEGADGMATCAGCSVWGDTLPWHTSWGVTFYDRFLNGPQLRRNLLYGHIFFNTVAFVLMHVQLMKPGGGAHRWHTLLGRLTVGALAIGVTCACWLATEHHAHPAYGGLGAQLGFYFMSVCVVVPAGLGVLAIRRGDIERHRVWMIRFVGALWGAYWLFRVALFFLDPLLREHDAWALLIVIWGSAPLGLAVAELWRRARDRAKGGDEPLLETTAVG
jgi:uncharacterized membrane protein